MAEQGNYDNNMPTTYDQNAASSGGGRGLQINTDYIKSPNAILKLVQAVLALITFICAAVWPPWAGYGGGWVMFVSMTTFILTLALFAVYLSDLVYKIPGPFQFMQVIYYLVMCILHFIAAVVASARSTHPQWGHSSVKACAVFAWFTLIAFVVDLVLQVMEWRRGGMPGLPARFGGTPATSQSQNNPEAAKET